MCQSVGISGADDQIALKIDGVTGIDVAGSKQNITCSVTDGIKRPEISTSRMQNGIKQAKQAILR
jgi:hypothetical protein